MNSGSLGHGLPVCVGMALAGKKDNRDYRVYTVMGDGEPVSYTHLIETIYKRLAAADPEIPKAVLAEKVFGGKLQTILDVYKRQVSLGGLMARYRYLHRKV